MKMKASNIWSLCIFVMSLGGGWFAQAQVAVTSGKVRVNTTVTESKTADYKPLNDFLGSVLKKDGACEGSSGSAGTECKTRETKNAVVKTAPKLTDSQNKFSGSSTQAKDLDASDTKAVKSTSIKATAPVSSGGSKVLKSTGAIDLDASDTKAVKSPSVKASASTAGAGVIGSSAQAKDLDASDTKAVKSTSIKATAPVSSGGPKVIKSTGAIDLDASDTKAAGKKTAITQAAPNPNAVKLMESAAKSREVGATVSFDESEREIGDFTVSESGYKVLSGILENLGKEFNKSFTVEQNIELVTELTPNDLDNEITDDLAVTNFSAYLLNVFTNGLAADSSANRATVLCDWRAAEGCEFMNATIKTTTEDLSTGFNYYLISIKVHPLNEDPAFVTGGEITFYDDLGISLGKSDCGISKSKDVFSMNFKVYNDRNGSTKNLGYFAHLDAGCGLRIESIRLYRVQE